MKMKKFAIVLGSLLLVASLGACRGGRGKKSSSGEQSSTSEKSSGDQSTSASSEKTSSGKTSSGEQSSSKSQASELTPEDLIKKIAKNIFDDETQYEEEDGAYYTGANWGTTSEYTLVTAVEEAIEYTPEEFTKATSVEEGTWDDGDDGAFCSLAIDDESILCDIGSYISGSDVVIQFAVYYAD